MKIVYIGIAGYGTVGKGTVDTLMDNADTIFTKTGIRYVIKGIADRRIDSKITDKIKNIQIKTTNPLELVKDPEIDIIVELMGGVDASKELITAAVMNKKHVVTANKALLAVHGEELFTLAEKNGVEIAFEASVGGGIPIIKVLKEDLAANNITGITAIINGTANYILSRMKNEGKEYAEILSDAQKLGYAEADPTFDVEGIDSAHKLTLLASIAFCCWVDFNDIFVEGITDISPTDIEFARELDCTIKLLAIARKDNGKIDVRVHPTMIPDSYMLAGVNDANNAVQVTASQAGDTVHYGRGAGSLPTGSAVCADIINTGRNIIFSCSQRVPMLGCVNPAGRPAVKSSGEVVSAYYLRFDALDHPGVLSSIAGVLAKNNISIRSALQRAPQSEEGNVPLVFLTHSATGAQINSAVSAIDGMDCVHGKTVIIRVEGIN